MSTQYDKIGKRYQSFKDMPVASIEKASILKYLGSVKDQHCIDLACGLGNWSHFLIEQGAARTVGVDISENMVKEAQASVPQDWEDTMTFQVGDCSKPLSLQEGPFDLAFGAWFLNYAPNYETMTRMWRVIYSNLKPGGRFVGIAPNTFCPMFEPFDDCYGVLIEPIEKIGERGWRNRLTAYIEPEPISFENYHFLHDVWEDSAKEAGMVDLRWHPAIPPDDERKESGFWDVYVSAMCELL